VANPRDSNARPERDYLNPPTDDVDNSDNFMPRNEWKLGIWHLAIDDVQISATHRASFHANSDLACPGRKVRSLL
jgi:hypothetical protein